MQYVRNKGNHNIIKPVEIAPEYIGTGEWEMSTLAEYNKKKKEKTLKDKNEKA